jgi:hypothetical protein
MERLVRCKCRTHCLTFNPQTNSYEGEGELVPKSTASNHRQDDLLPQTLDTLTQNVATRVLRHAPPPESLSQGSLYPGFGVQNAGSHNPPLDDFLFSLEAEVMYRCAWASTNLPLVFVDPSPTLRYQTPSTSELHAPNREPYALDPENRANVEYLENESRLCEILGSVGRRPPSDTRDRLLARVYEGLKKMEIHKETEWNRQMAGSIARRRGYSVVDTGMHNVLVCSKRLSLYPN